MEGNEIRLRGKIGYVKDRTALAVTHTPLTTFYIFAPTGRKNFDQSPHEACIKCAAYGDMAYVAYTTLPGSMIEVTGLLDRIDYKSNGTMRWFYEVRCDTFRVIAPPEAEPEDEE